MQIAKIAIILASLVIVGLLIVAVVTGVIPGAFEYAKCAFGDFLKASSSANLDTCIGKFTDKLKFNGA